MICGRLGAAARGRRVFRRPADLRVAQIDHVSRKSCYFFVRPKRNFLEVCVFLGRTLKAPQVRRRSGVEIEVRARHARHAPRRG